MSAQRTFLAAAVAIVAACGSSTHPGGGGGGADAGASSIAITPATLSVEVDDGVAVTQAYTAQLVAADGTMTDVTSQVTFTIDDSSIGYFTGTMLTMTGGGAGTTKVHAALEGATGAADVKVLVKVNRIDPSAPSNAPSLFGSASTDPTKNVVVAYPADQVIVPLNLGNFEVHWTDGSGDNLYEVSMKNDFVDLRLYFGGAATGWGAYLPSEWAAAAHGSKDLTVTVRSMNTAAPATAGVSKPVTVHLTNDEIQGGIYYWAAAAAAGQAEGIWRHDMAKPADPPEQFYTTAQTPNGRCVACHALSRDGTKMAVTYDGGDQSASIVDVATLTAAIQPGVDYWNFATFSPDGSKLLVVHQTQLTLRSGADGSLLATVPNAGVASQPDFAPSGDKFVYVQRNPGSDWSFTGGSLYTMSYDDSNLTFGAAQPLVISTGENNYYPSYSPDGQWILFNRAADDSSSYNSAAAEVWVVKADGSQPPILLQAADVSSGLCNSWARWAPFQSTYGDSQEPLYWITFSSKRDFGVRLTAAQGNTRPQIWMTPFFPDRMSQQQDPTAPSFHLPFQDIGTSNHIAQWTQRVVAIN